jgi:hypothetical protein
MKSPERRLSGLFVFQVHFPLETNIEMMISRIPLSGNANLSCLVFTSQTSFLAKVAFGPGLGG